MRKKRTSFPWIPKGDWNMPRRRLTVEEVIEVIRDCIKQKQGRLNQDTFDITILEAMITKLRNGEWTLYKESKEKPKPPKP